MRPESIALRRHTLQPLEAMWRQGHLRPEDGRSGLRGRRFKDGDGRRNLFESSLHGNQPAVEKGAHDARRGLLIGWAKDGMTAGQVSDYTGVVATRYDRSPKVFLSVVALAAIVVFWL